VHEDHKQTKRADNETKYVKKHQLSIGMLLAGAGAAAIALMILDGWINTAYWRELTPSAFNCLIPFLISLLFAISLCSLILGIALLYKYSKRQQEKHLEIHTDKEKGAFTVATCLLGT
jgi:hypothetical protein